MGINVVVIPPIKGPITVNRIIGIDIIGTYKTPNITLTRIIRPWLVNAPELERRTDAPDIESISLVAALLTRCILKFISLCAEYDFINKISSAKMLVIDITNAMFIRET